MQPSFSNKVSRKLGALQNLLRQREEEPRGGAGHGGGGVPLVPGGRRLASAGGWRRGRVAGGRRRCRLRSTERGGGVASGRRNWRETTGSIAVDGGTRQRCFRLPERGSERARGIVPDLPGRGTLARERAAEKIRIAAEKIRSSDDGSEGVQFHRRTKPINLHFVSS